MAVPPVRPPRNGVVTELLEIANGDAKLIFKAGTWQDGKLFVNRAKLIELVKEQQDAKGNESSDGPGSPAVCLGDRSPEEVSSSKQGLRKLFSLLFGNSLLLLRKLVQR